MAPSQTFPLRYGVFRPLLSLLGTGPGSSAVELDEGRLRARMGWAFRADVPLSSVKAVRPYTGLVTGIGVHGWRGRWLVNGAASGLVDIDLIDLDPPARAYVLGIQVRLHTLRVSVESPEELIAALGSESSTPDPKSAPTQPQRRRAPALPSPAATAQRSRPAVSSR